MTRRSKGRRSRLEGDLFRLLRLQEEGHIVEEAIKKVWSEIEKDIDEEVSNNED